MQAKEILAKALDLAEQVVTEDISLETCANWDSLAHLRLVIAIEAAIGRPLEPTEVFGISGYDDVVLLLDAD